jgi:hypothetical protein
MLTMVRLMRSSNHRVALAASMAVLERAIGKATPQTTHRDKDRLSDEDYRSFAERLSKAQAEIDAADRLRETLKWP